MRSFLIAISACVFVLLSEIAVANDQGESGVIAQAGKAAAQDEPIDFDRAREMLRKRNSGERLTPVEQAYLQRAMEARQRMQRGAADARDNRRLGPSESIGLKPLDEMSAEDRYLDQDGGLYGSGSNEPTAPQRNAAWKELKEIRPLDTEGKPSQAGKVVLVSISMSNATQEFSRFKQIADQDPDKSPDLHIVDCAQGGQAMAEWVSPDAQPWTEALRRIERAGVSTQQVQVAWIKLANKAPHGDLMTHGRQLESDTAAVIQNAKSRFPNLRIAYLSSRIYGGYSGGSLNPEPYAYETAFVARWLIQRQIESLTGGTSSKRSDADQPSLAASPLLLWGPYLWADGTTPRQSDGLVWQREDLAGDGTHPSNSGRDKVARLLLAFFKQSPFAKSWYLGIPVETP